MLTPELHVNVAGGRRPCLRRQRRYPRYLVFFTGLAICWSAAIIGWKADLRRDDQVETALDLVSAAGAQALGVADYGIAVGSVATLFPIGASRVAETVAAHPPRKLVMFNGEIVHATARSCPSRSP